jgi:4-hydroxy-3-methylbut-2-enyl diphosphate reductase
MSRNGTIILAFPRGFCAGVRRALDAVEQVLAAQKPPVYVFHEIVHNDHVVDSLRRRGVVFVDRLTEVPDGATLVFSAHGVAKEVEKEAAARGLRVIDATCPLVKKIHRNARAEQRKGRDIILIGHKGHPETAGTFGQLDGRAQIAENTADVAELPPLNRPVWFSQTTLCAEEIEPVIRALEQRFPDIADGGGICYATRNRQQAIRALCAACDFIFVIGSQKSSNSRRLLEIATRNGVPAQLINGPREINADVLPPGGCIGITAAASAPEILVEETVQRLAELGWNDCTELKVADENVSFAPPSPQS